uniref:DUF417 family protein n=1 Tax=Escherichia coli TaxID=562 RepID=UPI0003EF563E
WSTSKTPSYTKSVSWQHHHLSGAGRLVLKDTLMLAGAVMIMADSAREILKQRSNESSSTLKTEY